MSNKFNGDDNVRPPDKVKKTRLVDDDPNNIFQNDEDFLQYKFLIMHDRTIPNEVKEAMIASKREQMVQMRKMGHVFGGGLFNPFFGTEFDQNSHQTSNRFPDHYNDTKAFSHGYSSDNYNIDDIDDITDQLPINNFQKNESLQEINTLKRNDAYEILIELIFAHYDEFNNYCNVEGLVLSIQQYLDNIIDEIILQADVCWGIRNNIELFCTENNSTKEKLKQIFIPDSTKNYEEFSSMINIQKTTKEIDDLEEINKQIQLQQELEEQEKLKKIIMEEEMKIKTQKIEKRKSTMNNLFLQLTKLGSYDNSVRQLKEEINEPVEKYLKLETENVFLKEELFNRTIKFIKQIRLDSTIKEELMNVFMMTNGN